MTFRPATIGDEELFWQWRLKAEDASWYGGIATTREEHHDWFMSRLGAITLLVWQDGGEDAGVARVDSNGEVAFSATVPRALLEELKPLAADYGGRLKATIDSDDHTTRAALEAAGFEAFPVRFYCYRP